MKEVPVFRILSACLMACAISGCVQTDPTLRNYSWHPTGATQLNLAAQVVNKNDLIQGRGATRPDTVEATQPVFRLWEGAPKALLPSNSRSGGGA